MKAFIIGTLVIMLTTQVRAEGIPCWIRCHCPPKIRSADDVRSPLRRSSNPPVNCLARTTGILTTYLGKILGIQGWRNYHLPARVSGTVTHAVGSSDGLYTIDLSIQQLTVGDQTVIFLRPSFIRIEVFPFVRNGAPLPVHANDELCVSGTLMWDADGFLEIHPKHSNEIICTKCLQVLSGIAMTP